MLLRYVIWAFRGVRVQKVIFGNVQNVHKVVLTVPITTAVGHLVKGLFRLQHLVLDHLLPLPVQHLPHLIFVALRVSGEKDLDICREDNNISLNSKANQ